MQPPSHVGGRILVGRDLPSDLFVRGLVHLGPITLDVSTASSERFTIVTSFSSASNPQRDDAAALAAQV